MPAKRAVDRREHAGIAHDPGERHRPGGDVEGAPGGSIALEHAELAVDDEDRVGQGLDQDASIRCCAAMPMLLPA